MLVDYDDECGKATGFSCYLGDWGTAYVGHRNPGFVGGGTPVYAGPRCFEKSNKDLFSFAQLALELFQNEGLGQISITENEPKLTDYLFKSCNFERYLSRSKHRLVILLLLSTGR